VLLLLLLLLCGAGQLSTLLDYIAALLVVPGHTAEAAAAIETVCKIVAAVGDRYRQQHDLLSLVLLFESTQVSSRLVGGCFVIMLLELLFARMLLCYGCCSDS